MENVIKTLEVLNLTEQELPEEIQEKISYLENLVQSHNSLVDELDEKDEVTEDEEKLVEQQSNKIDSLDARISQEIQNFSKLENEKKAKAKHKAETEKKEKEEAAKKAEEEAEAKKKAEEEAANKKPVEKKSGIGLGGFILGAVVLIATAGAVNAFRNK